MLGTDYARILRAIYAFAQVIICPAALINEREKKENMKTGNLNDSIL